MKNIIRLKFLAISLLFQQEVFAQSKDMPPLTITGRISKTNSTDKLSYVISKTEMEKLPRKNVNVKTDYSKETNFSGPLFSDVLKYVGADKSSKQVILTGLDGYKTRAPIADFSKYGVILADTIGVNPMTLESKGPYWVIYPIDKFKDQLNDVSANSKMVWNLVKIEVR